MTHPGLLFRPTWPLSMPTHTMVSIPPNNDENLLDYYVQDDLGPCQTRIKVEQLYHASLYGTTALHRQLSIFHRQQSPNKRGFVTMFRSWQLVRNVAYPRPILYSFTWCDLKTRNQWRRPNAIIRGPSVTFWSRGPLIQNNLFRHCCFLLIYWITCKVIFLAIAELSSLITVELY